MFVRKVVDRKSNCTRIQICESHREGKTVRQKIVRHVGIARDPSEVEKYSRLAMALITKEMSQQNNCTPLFDDGELLEQHYVHPTSVQFDLPSVRETVRITEGPKEILDTIFDEAGFGSVFESERKTLVLKAVVRERISEPDSKLGTTEKLLEKGQEKIDVNEIYRMMDALDASGENVLSAAFSSACGLYPDGIDLVCFDVTTLYFESTKADELRKFGYSKDQKFHSVQVTLALATTNDGIPVGYRLFPGNTAETKTLYLAIEEWRKVLPIKDVIFVADRGMFSLANLKEIEDSGYKFIVAAKLRSMTNLVAEEIFSESGYSFSSIGEDCDAWWLKKLPYIHTGKLKDEDGKNRVHNIAGNLIISWSSKRARKDASDRITIIEKIDSILSAGNENPAKRLVSNSGYKKYASFKGKTAVAVDQNKVEEDQKWDGMHGIFTNCNLSALEVVKRYRHLLAIEDSFRISKHDLKMRPIYHHSPRRVRAHVALCFIALCVIRRLQIKLRKAGTPMSVTRIREALNSTQSSILVDGYGTKFGVPSKMTEDALTIYKSLGLKRSVRPTVLHCS